MMAAVDIRGKEARQVIIAGERMTVEQGVEDCPEQFCPAACHLW